MSNLSSVLAAPLTPNARATSRLVTRAGGLTPFGAGAPERKASTSSREGRASVGASASAAPRAPGRDADLGLEIFFGKAGSQLET